jgi:hypothetical protein
MRLIHARTLTLREFFDTSIPDYAILSHTWGNEEVIFADMQNGNATAKEGFNKIKLCCNQALLDGFDYVWIDTCCIDKSSSAELSEAINSMWKFYKDADICYVYLQDYEADLEQLEDQQSPSFQAFAKCRWFTRGWTLQELIAPIQMAFYDESWIQFGSKFSLCKQLCHVTGIDEEVLSSKKSLSSVPIARKMCWAANRHTTRPEDVAYCLLGIFNVNMPLLYGEGEKAFPRLVEQIIKDSDDHSIFAWKQLENSSSPRQLGLLPYSPICFAQSGAIIPYQTPGESSPYAVTNKGLEITLDLEDAWTFGLSDRRMALLNCWEHSNSCNRVGLLLRWIEGDQYARLENTGLVYGNFGYYSPQKLFVKQNDTSTHMHASRSNQKRDCHIIPYMRSGTQDYYCERQNIRSIAISTVTSPRRTVYEEARKWCPGILAIPLTSTSFYIMLGLDDAQQTFCLLQKFKNKDQSILPQDPWTVYNTVMNYSEPSLETKGWARSQEDQNSTFTARMQIRSSENHIDYCVWFEVANTLDTKMPNTYRKFFSI